VPAERPTPAYVRVIDRSIETGENIAYTFVGLALAVVAFVVLVAVAHRLVLDLDHGTEDAVKTALDGLLLVFILLELLAGVRATITERKLIAEPFLIVGIIASIKEIVVLSLDAKPGSEGSSFDDRMVAIAVLGVLVFVLSAATYLVRRKEREPEEADGPPTDLH
jgi:uncharacterized membrane protein (DUF373 family)